MPKVCMMIDKSEQKAVQQLLHERGFAGLIPDEDVPRTRDGVPVTGGLFAVEDRPGKWRLIYDGRTPNHILAKLRWMRLPLGTTFSRAILKPHGEIRGSSADLELFFSAPVVRALGAFYFSHFSILVRSVRKIIG